ncbi:HAD family hydrolase [Mesobaculum littorinae]|uniref:HAD family hydrolase n=1 Tax=Mesobaculum littorinae TaxID=2486419 RepID=A0A438AJH5_9RHOB|nr:HAD-IA family hydrolase [Mesobaculum littorinae]RVV98809.1 HAD family hydrolase [Mesobaculum littorinae]
MKRDGTGGRGGGIPALRCVVFDKDGTLFDFHATWSAWAAAVIADLSQGDAARAMRLGHAIGFDTEAGRFLPGSPVVAGTPDEIAALMAPHVTPAQREGLTERLNAAATRAPQVEAVPLAQLFDRLAASGVAAAVVTNDAEAAALAHLRAAGVAERFVTVIGFDSGHGAKPGAGPLLAAAAAAGVPPEDCAMVGDSLHDLAAARAAGMAAVAVLTGPAGADELGPAADVVLPDISALPEWLAARNGAAAEDD